MSNGVWDWAQRTTDADAPQTGYGRTYWTNDGQFKARNSSGVKRLIGAQAVLGDVKAQNTAPASLVATTWTTRELQEVTDTDSLVAVTSNQFVLAVGTWQIVASGFIAADAATTLNIRHRVRNITTSTTLITGKNVRVKDESSCEWTMVGQIVSNGTDAYAIQYYADGTGGALGYAMNVSGESERYLDVLLTRIS